ncbi:histidine phosphatase family protein [Pontibacter sp. KCTC 32443]|uniref:SixA phosphatase family protein n=1 Tax=Pontibacter TaxID=323449 RepID=UPI00164D2BFD|nr:MULTISPECIES: histidine phosphatase family protein [Pontibacter]MBC5773810.1 histidine phosphatase family protein [Pontibacter sp. KCTC 32443]
MKLPFYFRFILALVIGLAWSCNQSPESNAATNAGNGTVTTVYVVRHAEKVTADSTNQDPVLTPAGEARAKALVAYLNGKPVDAVYSTKYKRNSLTVKPLADARKMPINTYEAHDFEGLKKQILQNNAGKTVVVVGHSNTILPIVEAFGAKKPFAEVADSKYDHIFKITIKADNTATVEAATYGAATN